MTYTRKLTAAVTSLSITNKIHLKNQWGYTHLPYIPKGIASFYSTLRHWTTFTIHKSILSLETTTSLIMTVCKTDRVHGTYQVPMLNQFVITTVYAIIQWSCKFQLNVVLAMTYLWHDVVCASILCIHSSYIRSCYKFNKHFIKVLLKVIIYALPLSHLTNVMIHF